MSDPFIGQIMMAGFNTLPRGFAQCNGQLMPIAQNNALFALLATRFGGNGTTNFALPDLRGRDPVGQGALPGGSTYTVGGAGGAEGVVLTSNTMPMHTHYVQGTSQPGSIKTPKDNVFAKNPTEAVYASPGTTVTLAGDTLGTAGASQAHPNMQPFLTINFMIALSGVYPTRN